MKTIVKGTRVKLLRQTPPHLTRPDRPVRIGTEGEVLGIRINPDGLQLLVKFLGHSGPSHTPAYDVEAM